MEDSKDNITIERIIAEAELIRNREEKLSLTDRLQIAKEVMTNI